VQHLLKAEPDAPRFQRDLSVSYNKIGEVQRAQGDLLSAMSSYKQSLEIRQKLAARDPAASAKCSAPRAICPRPLSSYKQGLEIRQKLAPRDLTNGGPEDMDFSTRGSNSLFVREPGDLLLGRLRSRGAVRIGKTRSRSR
jgi:hypothetical protein